MVPSSRLTTDYGSVLWSIRTREWCHLVDLQLIKVASSRVYVYASGAIICITFVLHCFIYQRHLRDDVCTDYAKFVQALLCRPALEFGSDKS